MRNNLSFGKWVYLYTKRWDEFFFREKEKRWLVTLKSFHIFESTTLSHTLGLSNWTKVKSTVGPKHQEPKKKCAHADSEIQVKNKLRLESDKKLFRGY